MARKAYILVMSLVTWGCAEGQDRIVEVKIPVPVPCAVATSERPAYADNPAAVRAAQDIFDRAKLLLAGREQRDQYIRELEAAVFGCSMP